jgi:hypothetical protein
MLNKNYSFLRQIAYMRKNCYQNSRVYQLQIESAESKYFNSKIRGPSNRAQKISLPNNKAAYCIPDFSAAIEKELGFLLKCVVLI